jgi:hypothetical protein
MQAGLKKRLLRSTNLLLYLSFCSLIGTGALLTWRLVPGSQGGRGLQVLGLGRHNWAAIHFWCGAVCLVAVIVHMLLNWQWLKKIASAGQLWRLVVGLGAGVGLILGIYFMPITRNHGQGQGTGHFGEASDAVLNRGDTHTACRTEHQWYRCRSGGATQAESLLDGRLRGMEEAGVARAQQYQTSCGKKCSTACLNHGKGRGAD